MLSVSIATVCNFNNNESLCILLEVINNQTYKNIKEWIIVDGSINDNTKFMKEFISNANINFEIKHIISSDKSICNLWNLANDSTTGDIIVCMNDNNYYFPSRVEYCVDLLSKSNINFGVCNNYYSHDFLLNKTIAYETTYPLNDTFAYKKEYLKNHRYIDNNSRPELSFCNNFKDQVIRLLPDHTMIHFLHINNFELYRKDFLNQYVKIQSFNIYNDNILEVLLPNVFYNLYNKLYSYTKNETLDFDIVYLSGIHSIDWDPKDTSLGGSEQAIINLSEEWVKHGKSVIVYGNYKTDLVHNGVHYVMCQKFPFHKIIKTLIIWRMYGILLTCDLDFKANNCLLDFHDNFPYTLNQLQNNKLLNLFKKVNRFMFKSQYHKDCFDILLKNKLNTELLNESQYRIIINGLRINEFKNNNNYVRQPYRLCYCSSYDRGLEPIIEKIWKYIYEKEPLAEIHVYYGMDYIYDNDYKNRITLLLGQPGVMDHGRQPMNTIIKEKYLSSFQLYLSNSIAEIDCINIRESLITGCIPIISNFGVFNNRDGLRYEWDPSNDELCKLIAYDIVDKMNDSNFMENARIQLMNSKTIVDWQSVAVEWLSVV